MYRLLLLSALLLTACAGYPLVVTPDFSALTLTPVPTVTPTEVGATPPAAATPGAMGTGDGEEGYYHGIYDLCQWIAMQAGRVVDCIGFTKLAREQGWYRQESPGWSWRDVAPELLSY